MWRDTLESNVMHSISFFLIRKFLTCPRNIPLYEVMYYDNVQEIKKVCMQLLLTD